MQDRISECRRLMQDVAQNKNIADENEKVARKNNTFFDAYKAFSQSLQSYLLVKEVFQFSPSDRTLASVRKAMEETQKVFQTKNVLNPSLYQKQVEECTRLLRQEWEDFSAKYALHLRNDLGIVQLITTQKSSISDLLRRLKACQVWPVTPDIASGCIKAYKEAEELLTGMHFDAHISEFLNKVKTNTATLLDLTPEVRKWLEEEQLTGKIFLKIQM